MKKKKLLRLELLTVALSCAIGSAIVNRRHDSEIKIEKVLESANLDDIIDDIDIEAIPMVRATTNVNIRTLPSVDGEKVGLLRKGYSLERIELMNNGWYKVNFGGEDAYICGKYVEETYKYYTNATSNNYVYIKEDTPMVIDSSITATGVDEVVNIPKNEVGEVIEEYENYYLIKTNEYFGIVAKFATEPLAGTFVVVDISDQELKLYVNNLLVLTSPIVSGKPKTPSDEGKFSINAIEYDRYLKGPGYKSYVDIFMPYNGGEGLHDAEYHTNPDGREHGWRSPEEFGGQTYLTNGSHGCINMLNDDVMLVSQYVEVGTPVIVKK